MPYDMTKRVAEAREYYDKLLDERISEISERSSVPADQMIKINPADFIEKSKYQTIAGYTFQNIRDFIRRKKNDKTFLISPLDEIEETAAQISYKSNEKITRTLRASKCDVVPVPKDVALDFCIRNHRQGRPQFSAKAVCFGLSYKGELVATMFYDVSNGAVRGRKTEYELVRLAICKGTRIHGGASKLQKACEATLSEMGVRDIYSYSNATINNGAVYEALGFDGKEIEGGQPFVIMENNDLIRLISLFPNSTDAELAKRGRLKTHVGGNRVWWKNISSESEEA